MAIPSNRALPDRILPRYAFEANIRIRLQRHSQNLTLLGWTRDLSESGVAAFVAQGLTLGELVTLEIPLPHSGTQEIPARVARSLGTEYGFQFTALSAEQRRLIQATFKGQAAIPYPAAAQKR
jgi:PilZ domain-containing protein